LSEGSEVQVSGIDSLENPTEIQRQYELEWDYWTSPREVDEWMDEGMNAVCPRKRHKLVML
jgi:hypothetical protein